IAKKNRQAMAETCIKRQLRHDQRKLHKRVPRYCHITIVAMITKVSVPLIPSIPRHSERNEESISSPSVYECTKLLNIGRFLACYIIASGRAVLYTDCN